MNKERFQLSENLRSACCSPFVISKVLAVPMRKLITARARKNKRTAHMLANARKDHSIPLLPVPQTFKQISLLIMASSVNRQDEPNLCCDWLPKLARWSYLARSGPPAVSCNKNFPEIHIINPLLTMLFGQDCSVETGLILFCGFMDLDSISGHKQQKQNLANI